jgi:two-component system OmpR family response regulator
MERRELPRSLVVDDEVAYVQGMRDFLHTYRLDVRTAESATSALGVLQRWRPGVVILDVMLPEVDGIALLKRLRADSRWAHLPVIVASALAGEEDLQRALEAGASTFISKPFTMAELRAALRRFVLFPGTSELAFAASSV